MGLHETEGLVLKSYNLSEADKIIIFLTKEQGLVRGVAKGVKRLKSRFGSSLEPFTFINLTYFQKDDRELVSIREVELVKSSFESASDPDLLSNFSYISELITEFVPPHDPNEKLYRMVKVCLETAVKINHFLIPNLVLYFEIWLLRLGGYLPNLNVCGNCKRNLFEDEGGNLQYNFQIFCRNCDTSKNRDHMSAAERNIINKTIKNNPETFVNLTENAADSIKRLSNKNKILITNIVGKQLLNNKSRTSANRI